MPGFIDKLIVSKVSGRLWEVEKDFTYVIGKKNFVKVPKGFITDLASIPRVFWSIFPPDGNYTQAAVLHDYLYQMNLFIRKECDGIFLQAMKILKVPLWKRSVMYSALRMFGWICWEKRRDEDIVI